MEKWCLSLFFLLLATCGYAGNLATPVVSDSTPPNPAFAASIEQTRSDMQFLGLVYSIADSFFSASRFHAVPERLPKTIRDKFRGQEEYLDIIKDRKIDLEDGVRYEGGIVRIAFEKNGRGYEIRVCQSHQLKTLAGPDDSGWKVSGRFAVKEVPVAQDPVAKFKAHIQSLLADKSAEIIWMTDLEDSLVRAGEDLPDDVIELLLELLKYRKFAVVTGSTFESVKPRFLDKLVSTLIERGREADLANFIFAANNGSEIYKYDPVKHKFMVIFKIDLKEKLGDEKYARIPGIIRECVKEKDVRGKIKEVMGWDDFKGDFIEERGSQVTFWVLGVNATRLKKIEFKTKRSMEIRKEYADFLNLRFKADGIPVTAKVSGSSAVDITWEGIDKGFAVGKIAELFGDVAHGKAVKRVVIFSGDLMRPGQNDEPGMQAADVGINVGPELAGAPTYADGGPKPYFSLPNEGPAGLYKFLECYIDLIKPDEPLIGHGYTDKDVNSLPITSWTESEAFKATVVELEKVISDGTIPNRIKTQLLKVLASFKSGQYDHRMGTTSAKYVNTLKYHLGFGTNRTIGLAPEFFDENSPFYRHRLEALFHELFHAASTDGRDEQSVGGVVESHLDAIRLSALLFWGFTDLTTEERDEIMLMRSRDFKVHSKNELGRLVREWKKEQEKNAARWLMERDGWKTILTELSGMLKRIRRTSGNLQTKRELIDYLFVCDKATRANDNHEYPIESRYPIMRAAALLDKEDQDLLVEVLNKNLGYRKLPVVDSILLMLSKEIPEDWLEKYAPNLVGRNIWQAAAEIWHAGGGLGRVMQYHGTAIFNLLGKRHQRRLKHIEPYYFWRKDETGGMVAMDYRSKDALPNPIVDELQEVERFSITIGNRSTEAIVYKGHNDLGIEVYLIKDRDGFFTHSLYNYNNSGNRPDLPTWEQFTEFISKATLELVRRQEWKAKIADQGWKAPVLHVNDAQFSLVGVDMRAATFDHFGSQKKYADDEVVKGLMLAFVTHTYGNREARSDKDGKRRLESVHVPGEFWHHFESYRGDDWTKWYDFTSAGLRLADWKGGVSRKQVKDVAPYDEWTGAKIVAVTNGDDRDKTAQPFREILMDKNVFPSEVVDIEHPTPSQIRRAKQEAKRRLKLKEGQYFVSRLEKDGSILNPNQCVIAYTGRLVEEKAGRMRAFTNENIKALVRAGTQVLIYGSVQNNKESQDLEAGLKALVEELRGDEYKNCTGKLIFVPRFGLKEQREAFGAIDIGVVDSHPHSEAAGFTETDFAAAGALVVAPPWPGGEGILANQGIKLNFDIPGEGNTVIPEITVSERELHQMSLMESQLRQNVELAYRETLLALASMKMSTMVKYQATSIRLSRVLEARMTGAEYLRQWNKALAKKEGIEIKPVDEQFGIVLSGEIARRADADMDAIHEVDINLMPAVPEGTVMYHIIPRSLIPQSPDFNQQNDFSEFIVELNRQFPNVREKIKIVTDDQMANVPGIMAAIANDEKDRIVMVDFAVSGDAMLDNLPDDAKALIFESQDGSLGDFRQLEGVLAALRALYIEDSSERIGILSRIYKILTNSEPPRVLRAASSSKDFARQFRFRLPAIELRDPTELKRLNAHLKEFIRNA